MAKILKINNHPQEEKIEDYISHQSKELKADKNWKPKQLERLPQYQLLKQRHNQRKILFVFCTVVSLVVFIAVLLITS